MDEFRKGGQIERQGEQLQGAKQRAIQFNNGDVTIKGQGPRVKVHVRGNSSGHIS